MTELRINGYEQIRDILEVLLPYIRFKKVQAKALHHASEILGRKSFKNLDRSELMQLVDCIIRIQESNYATKHKKTKAELLQILDLTP